METTEQVLTTTEVDMVTAEIGTTDQELSTTEVETTHYRDGGDRAGVDRHRGGKDHYY